MNHSNRNILLSILVGASLAACGGAGTGKGLRTDVTTQMNTIEPTVAGCYKEALARDRTTKGTIVLAFKIEPKTGKFIKAAVVSSNVGDNELETCVVAEVTKLVLAKPQKTKVGVDTYPIRFSPSS
jgi:hypothetical protein